METPRPAEDRSARLPVVCLLLFAAVAGTVRLKAYDLFWHLAGGRWILEHGALPRTDPFRFTSRDVPWVDHEWLFQVVVAGLERVWGLPSLVVGLAVLVVALAALLFTSLRREGALAAGAALVVLVAVLGARGRFFLRPELASLFLLPVSISLLQSFRRTGSRVPALVLPALVVLWVNFHPGALLAPVVTAAYLVGTRLPGGRRLIPLGWVLGLPVLTLLALLANPYGARLFTVPFGIAEALRGLPGTNPEWLPVWKQPVPFLFFFCGVAALLGLAILGVVKARRLDPATGLVAVLLAVLASTGLRHQGLFFVGAAFFAGEILADLSRVRDSNQESRPLGKLLVPLACLLAAFWCVLPSSRGPLRPRQGAFRPGFGIEPGRFPEKAVDDLAKRQREGQPVGNLYNDVAFGGYLLWRLYPPRQVFIDARNEVNPGLFHELAAARASEEGWTALLARYGIDGALVRYDDRPRPVLTPSAMPGGPPQVEHHTTNALFFPRERFALVYWDDVAMIFLRRTPGRAALLEREEYRFVHPEDWRATLARAEADPLFRTAVLEEIERRLREDPEVVRALQLRQALEP
jgi:hypothetical protein